MKMLLLFVALVPAAVRSCPTCYGTSVEYAPPFFSDDMVASKHVQARMTQRPAYTENYSNSPSRGPSVMPRYGKRNSVGRDTEKKPMSAKQEPYVQDLDTVPTLR
jgi:hypothetical protein